MLGLMLAAPTIAAATPVPAAPSTGRTSEPETTTRSALESSGPLFALQEGNRLFEAGDLEGAIAAYRLGHDPEKPNSTLIYNLATALHHSDQLPEAILWYRRGMPDDPWVEENLWLARKSLGSQSLPITGLYGWLANYGQMLADGLVVWVWLTFLGAALLPDNRLKSALGAAALGTLLYLALAGVATRAPKAIVLLEDCHTRSAELPAGTEAWASKTQEGWRIAGADDAVCPNTSVAVVNP